MMEKRFWMAMGLSLLILFAWQKLVFERFYPSSQELQKPAATAPAAPVVAKEEALTPVEVPSFEEKRVELQSDRLKAVFSNRGGTIQELALKDYDDPGSKEPIFLVRSTAGETGSLALDVIGRANLAYVPFEIVSSPSPQQVTFRYERPGEFRVTKIFTLLPERHALTLELVWENLSASETPLQAELGAKAYVGARNGHYDEGAIRTSVMQEDRVKSQDFGKLRKGAFVAGPLGWVSIERKYFVTIVRNEEGFLESFRAKKEEGETIAAWAKLPSVPLGAGQSARHRLLVYAGPVRLEELRSYHAGFEKVFSQGSLGFLRVGFLWLLNFFYRFLRNYGLAILALTILIRLLLSPLMHFSFESMKRMQELQPKLEVLRKQYEKDPQRLNKETMDLYKRHKVNPFGGCLPMLLQLPIFIALWQLLSQAIELRNAPFFLWMNDLSSPDRLFTLPWNLPFLGNAVSVLPILTIVTMLWQQALTPTTTMSKEQQQIMWIMPVVFGFLFYKLPSGVLLYWCATNLITIFHQLIMFKQGFLVPRKAQ